MVGSLEWVNKFKNHEAFKRLKLKLSEKKKKKVSRNILAYRNGDVFLWDETSQTLLCFQLKNILVDSQKEFCQELSWINPPRFEVDYLLLANPSSNNLALYGSGGVQVLSLPTYRPKVDPETCISCSCMSIDEHFFVTSGHSLLHLKFHPGFSSPDVLFILTSNNFIRIYSTDHPQEALTIINLQPLSPVPLSSGSLFDEAFVAFDFSEMLEMKTSAATSNASNYKNTSAATTPNYKTNTPNRKTGLNLSTTSTPKLNLSTTTTTTMTTPKHSSTTTTTISVPAWHLYLLMANGQVGHLTVVFDGVNTFRHIIHGMMRLHPAADDNYGLDACHLLHLPTTPPLLVVATSDGHLHHSLILNPEAGGGGYDDDDEEEEEGVDDYSYGGGGVYGSGRSVRKKDSRMGGVGDNDEGEDDDNDGSFLQAIKNLSTSANQSGRSLCIDKRGIISNPDNKKALYVYQTIELEMQLSTPTVHHDACAPDNDGGDYDDDTFYNRPILLHRDPTNKYRYHCTHSTGLHSILPFWLHSLEQFFAAGKDEQWRQDDQTIVEHLVCTSPLPSSSTSTRLIGVVQISDAFLGNHLIILNHHYHLSLIPYLQSHKLETHPLKVATPFVPSGHPSHHLPPSSSSSSSEDLLARIKKMLIKDATNPFIMSASGNNGNNNNTTTSEECFGLLCRATQVFRTEYIGKYDLVRVEIDKNVSRLEKVKGRQVAEQARLERELQGHMRAQEALKNKLNRVLEEQVRLCERVNRLLVNAEKGSGALSEAERAALTTLLHLQETVSGHSKRLALLKKKSLYHDEVVGDSSERGRGRKEGTAVDLPKEKADSIKKLLKKEGEEIASLIKELKKAQIL